MKGKYVVRHDNSYATTNTGLGFDRLGIFLRQEFYILPLGRMDELIFHMSRYKCTKAFATLREQFHFFNVFLAGSLVVVDVGRILVKFDLDIIIAYFIG